MKKGYGNKSNGDRGKSKSYSKKSYGKNGYEKNTSSKSSKKIHSHRGGRTKQLYSNFVESVKVDCYSMDEEGFGIIQYKKQSLKVKGLLKGEVAIVKIYEKGRFFEAVVEKIIKPSNDRVKAPCMYYDSCGGCQLQHMSNQGQNKWKQSIVEKLLASYGEVMPIITMNQPYHYRNKISETFGKNKKGQVISGFYKLYSHELINIDSCMIQDEKADGIIKTIEQIAKKYKMTIYNEDTQRGFLRHVLIRTGFTSGEVMVILVTTDKIFTGKNNFMKILRKKHPEITTVVLNVNDEETNMILGEEEYVLYGKGYIQDELCGMKFNISPRSFYQINAKQTEKLYGKAIDFAELTGEELVLDAYSGIGTIGILASQKAKTVIGVELNADAVRNANHNVRVNHIKNAKFFEGDAGEFMVNMADEGEKIDVVFMDPPRSGSTEVFMDAVVKLSPEKVVYVSCNPVTQKRDLEYFTAHGYEVKKIQPVDMFPQTGHVECVIGIHRKK